MKKKTTHDYLFDTFSKDRETKYVGENRDRGLKELTILKQTREIKHGDEIALPPGTEKIAGLFRHFAFHGADLDRIKEIYVYPFSPDKAPPRSKQLKDFYRVQMPSLPVSDKPYEPMKIRFLMKKESDTCRIDDLIFIAQKQIPPAFDDIPYRDLGSEHPRETVEITVDTTHQLSIGGSTDLHRDRWFRMHVSPGMTHPSFEEWAAERGFLPGRGFMKFNPALTRGWGKTHRSLKNEKTNPEPPTSLSSSDTTPAIASAAPSPPSNKNPTPTASTTGPNSCPSLSKDAARPSSNTSIPPPNSPPDTSPTKSKTPATPPNGGRSKTKAASSPSGPTTGRKPKASTAGDSSPISTTKSPTPSTKNLPTQSWRPLIRLHASPSQRLPTFPRPSPLHHRNQRPPRFLLSPLLRNALTLGAHERRGLGYSNYLLGRYEALLDMLRAHMHKVDHVLPMLITECGSLQNGREPSDNWLRLHAWNAYLTKSMQRPDQIDLFVPFIFST